MDLNQHSFIRTAFDDQTILISKAKFETAVHIHQTNTGTMLMRPFFSIEKLCGFFLRHSKSVIFYLQINVIFFPVSAYMDFSFSIHKFHSIIDSIFQKRLENQLHCTSVQNLRIYLEIYLKTVFITDFLDVHIVLRMLHFILNPDHCFSTAQADPEQAGKLRDHKHRIIITLSCDHPYNRIQRIIQEMRVDLRLKCIQFALSFFFLFHHNVIHQLADLCHCRAQGFPKMFHFHGTAYINIRFHISGLPFLHGIIQSAQRFGDSCRYHLIQDHCCKNCQRNQKNHQISHS